MNPTAIVFNIGELTLCFETMKDAVSFIEGQSANAEWKRQWTFTYNSYGGVNASTERRVSLHFSKSPTS